MEQESKNRKQRNKLPLFRSGAFPCNPAVSDNTRRVL